MVYPGQVLGTTFKIKVLGNWIFMETANHHLPVAVCLGNNTNYPVYKSGGFGLISWANGQPVDITINNLKTY